jgi:lipopolysaccharide export system protein LptA
MKGLSLRLSIGVLNLVLAVSLSSACADDGRLFGENDSRGRTDITADKFQTKSRAGVKESVFDRNVTLKLDNVTLSCDKLVIVYDEKKARLSAESKGEKPTTTSTIKSITASGNVKITQDERMATAEKALWDFAKRTITLTEGVPRYQQGHDSVSGHRIIMYLDENYAAIEYGDTPSDFLRNPQKEKEK